MIQGHYESRWFDVNASFAPLLPPIVPEGRYKFRYRGYTSNKKTLFIFENQVDGCLPTKEYREMGEFKPS